MHLEIIPGHGLSGRWDAFGAGDEIDVDAADDDDMLWFGCQGVTTASRTSAR
jgi:hypothetical protein